MSRRINVKYLKMTISKELEKLMIEECNKLFLIYKLNILLNKQLIDKKEYDLLIKKYT